MLFQSWEFLLFFIPLALLYALLRRTKLRLPLLLAGSYLFYACWDWRSIFFLAFITLSDYCFGRLIGRYERRKRWFLAGSLVTEYSARNAYRLDPYHRLDLSLNWNIVKRKRFETSLNFSVYNVYNRKNPFFIFFETTTNFVAGETFDLHTKAYQMSLFPILPSITWNFKF